MKLISIIILTILSFNVNAIEVKGKINSPDRVNVVQTGELINLSLEIYPSKMEIVQKVKDLEGKRFLDYFYLHKLEAVNISENNPDYIVAEVLMVPVAKPKQNFVILQLGDENIPVEIDIDIRETPMREDKQFNTWPIEEKATLIETIKKSSNLLIIATIILIISLLGSFLFLKKRKKAVKTAEIISWKSLNSRNEFEEAFLKFRKKEDISFETSPNQELLKLIEENMYKPKWDESLLERLKDISREE